VLALLLIVAAVIVVAGIVHRVHAQHTLAEDTTAVATPDVTLAKPETGAPAKEIVLPGNVFAFKDSPIFARTNGYLEHWYFDIGARVRAGQLLAVISTPEIDKQLLQARADLATAEANAGYAKTTATRYQGLLGQNAVSQQDTENFTTQAASTSAAVKSQLANVKRLEDLQSFERVYAPFNGIVTSRSVDIGQLIDSGANKEMFHMASTDVLRVYTSVPQVYSRDARVGAHPTLTFPQYPGRTFTGTLVRTANSIDLASRTLLVEVDVDNRDGALAPGSYAEVHLEVSQPRSEVIIPVSALLFRREGLRVASVQSQNGSSVGRLLPVTLGHDDGTTVQVLTGLSAEDEIISNPPDSVVDGEKVHPVNAATEAQ
jgi:RND family efflux transporter MFP subunit